VEPESDREANDPNRSSYDRAYWLRRCEGFLVETPAKRIGRVTGIRYGDRADAEPVDVVDDAVRVRAVAPAACST
jgi:hypothetical protein